MTKELNILRDREDGTLRLSYAGIDLDDYDYITVDEFIEAVEETDMWSDIEAEVYAEALDEYGLDYSSYDDPDTMWNDFLKAVDNDR